MSYYRTIVVIEILSENEPADGESLLAFYEPAVEGEQSAVIVSETSHDLTPEAAAQLLIMQGSDPEFFGLTG